MGEYSGSTLAHINAQPQGILPDRRPRIHLHPEDVPSSCLATHIMKLLPHNTSTQEAGDIIEFDNLRQELKQRKISGSVDREKLCRYKKLTAVIGVKMMAKELELGRAIENIEKSHFLEHHELPNKTKDKTYSNLLQQRRAAKSILRNLGIHF